MKRRNAFGLKNFLQEDTEEKSLSVSNSRFHFLSSDTMLSFPDWIFVVGNFHLHCLVPRWLVLPKVCWKFETGCLMSHAVIRSRVLVVH